MGQKIKVRLLTDKHTGEELSLLTVTCRYPYLPLRVKVGLLTDKHTGEELSHVAVAAFR